MKKNKGNMRYRKKRETLRQEIKKEWRKERKEKGEKINKR